MMVRKIESDGTIRTRNLGGLNYYSLDGETVTIHTLDGRKYTGLMVCQSHSTHVFEDARSLERNENTMLISLDEKVSSREDVEKLGISHGDFISIEPQDVYKRQVFALLKEMKEQGLTPAYDTWFAFPHYEEIGHGGSYVPDCISEYVALDIAVMGGDHCGSESKVSICMKDNFSPYDRELTRSLIEKAKAGGVDFVQDVFFHYGTDANAVSYTHLDVYKRQE